MSRAPCTRTPLIDSLAWILVGGFLMSAIALVGGVTTFLGPATLDKLLLPLASRQVEVAGLVLFGAGNFIYIAASDLVPEIKSHRSPGGAAMHFGLFLLGLTVTLLLAVIPS